MNLLQLTDRGIYCEQAGIYLDPWKKVTRAIITHGHADHAIRGHQAYICHRNSVPLLKARLGDDIPVAGLEYGETHHVNGVHFTLYPAGHILGSAQVKVEYKREVWVYAGDYKVENDGISQPFEPVKCHTFITESTFALPVYSWENQEVVFEEINQWWKENKEQGKVSVMLAYSLGKAQRLLKYLDPAIGNIYAHETIEKMNAIHRRQGILLPETRKLSRLNGDKTEGALVMIPPATRRSDWMKSLGNVSVAVTSGWMATRSSRKQRGADVGFVLSDHADWKGLNSAVEATEAERVWVGHGYTDIFARWLKERGLQAEPLDDLKAENE